MSKENVITAIRNVATGEIPKGARVLLYGSRARGDARQDSDWDLLMLLDKKQLTSADHDQYSYPFWELGWRIDAMIHPAVYMKHDWENKANPIFKENVEREGIVIC